MVQPLKVTEGVRTSDRIFDGLFSALEIAELFGTTASIQALLDVESALAQVQAELDIIPSAAAFDVVACCEVSLYDLSALVAGITASGNSAIPLVKALTARVAERAPDSAAYVHWGATSQDIMDTAVVLQLKRALDWIIADNDQLADALAKLAEVQRHAVMPGRTWMQQALPVTLGLKAAGWLDAVLRHSDRLRAARSALPLQFGGAVGTLAAHGGHGRRTAKALAERLELSCPDISWHASRDQLVAPCMALSMLAGTLGKIGRDVSLLMQTEVDEAAEPQVPGKGGSSTMPHKRNPVACAVALAAATRVPGMASTMLSAMVQEHERGLGGWHAEWETVPDIVRLVHGAQRQILSVCQGLTVDVEHMQRNLQLTDGLIMAEAVSMALASDIGRDAAHVSVEAACRYAIASRASLADALEASPAVSAHLTRARIDALLEPGAYLGETDAMIDAVIARYRSRASGRSV